MFDPSSFTVNSVSLIALVFGLVEFCKAFFGISGKWVTGLAAVMGLIVMVAYQLVGVVADPYGQILEIVVVSVAFGLSASGFYKFTSARLPKRD